jgi:putative hydrolase of the HAD superfamily
MPDWKQIHCVLLDMDGTLLDLRYDNHFWLEHMPRRYAEHRAMPLETARQELLGLYRQAEGTLNWYCMEYWTATLGLDIPQLSEEVAHLIAEQEHALEFLARLRHHGKRRVLVTNAHRHGIALKMRHTGLQAQLDQVISSHDLGFPKEHPEFWHKLAKIEHFDLARTLLIDDSLPVLRTARDYGIGHMLAVQRPDSGQPPRDIREFPLLRDFAELLHSLPR